MVPPAPAPGAFTILEPSWSHPVDVTDMVLLNPAQLFTLEEKITRMQNEHGLTPPIAWKKTAWNWQAIDADGNIYTFKDKPTRTADGWRSQNPAWCMEWGKRKPPKDFTKCLWERPKINHL